MKLDGVNVLKINTHKDLRGELTAFDRDNMPFEAQRFFYILMPKANVPRAEHACNAEQMIIVAQGRARFDLNDGLLSDSVEMAAGNTALWIKPGRWLRMVGLEDNTLLVVLASTIYSETEYFDNAKSYMNIN